MKKVFLMIIGLILLAGCQGASAGLLQDQPSEMEFEPVRRGTLEITVGADGVVSAYQTGLLIWGTTGTVGQVQVQVGDRVQKDQPLASLEQSSLPQAVILAQVEVTAAQKALEDLQLSQVQRAQAWQAVEAAEQALEDARNPASIQAEAQARVANTQKTLDEARRLLDILTTPPSQAAINQAYANLVMAENVLNSTHRDIERIEKRINKPPEAYLPWENRQIYRNILQGLELKLASVQRSYEEAEQKYNRLLEPANPNDIAQAEADLARAQAEFGQAERDLGRVKDGTSPADLAVLQARLDDARREWDRLKNGPPAEEVAAAQARLAAAQSTLKLAQLEAPFTGIVTMVAVYPGDQVAPGTQAFRLDDLSRLLVETQVSEIDINRIQPGQSVVVTFDSILAKEYQGEVVEVSPVANIVQGLASFTVKVELMDADELVKPGMTASATFVVSELEDVLLVPMRALRVLENQRVIYTWRNNQEIPVTVRIGATSGSYAQVLEGDLQPGDQIVLTPGGGSQAEQ